MTEKLRKLLTFPLLVLLMFFMCVSATAEKTKLTIWWGGGWMNPNVRTWWEKAVPLFEMQHPDIELQAVEQSTDTLVPSFKSAAAAKQGPDVAFLWEGVWCLEDAWDGNLAPLSDYWKPNDFKPIVGNASSTWDGKIWRAGIDIGGKALIYNKQMFSQAGVDPEKPIANWDQFVSICKKLKAAGITPIGAGMKDVWYGGWLASFLQAQDLNSEADIIAAVLGKTSLTDKKHALWWDRLDTMIKQQFFNNDVMSLEVWAGWDLLPQKKVAMIIGSDSLIVPFTDALGVDNIGISPVPSMGTGKMAGQYFVEIADGYSVTSWSKRKSEAADFIKWLVQKDQVNSYFTTTGILPANKLLDESLIKLPQLKQIWKLVKAGNTGPHLENFWPSYLDEKGYFVAVSKMFGGEMNSAQAASFVQDVNVQWRKENPDRIKNYEKWLK